MTRYPLSPNAIFWSYQGEGHLRGFQMAFIRLAGCSVGCGQCDTDYSVDSRATESEIVDDVISVTPPSMIDRWAWVTGGEPSDRDLGPLFAALRTAGYSIALATSGVNRVIPPVDWLSVSPHGNRLMQRLGNEIKLVDGLGGLDLDRWYAANPPESLGFMFRYVQPLSINGVESKASLERCMKFADAHPNWALSRQDHLHWRVP